MKGRAVKCVIIAERMYNAINSVVYK